MIELLRTNPTNKDFIPLVKELDAYLAEKDGDEHAFYSQLNTTGKLKHVVVAYENGIAIGCGAIKEFNAQAMEVKRMYVSPQSRGKGLGAQILLELEAWVKALGYTRCVLETGKRQPEAIHLYEKSGYRVIPNYGQYMGMENSICFEKVII